MTEKRHQLNSVIFLQARISSTRLPNKVIKKVFNKPLIGYLLDRLMITNIPIWVLYPRSEKKAFIKIRNHYPEIFFFGGSKYNVLKRFFEASQLCSASNYIRVTGDNPFTSVYCLMKLLKEHIEKGADLSYYQDLPYGAGVEIISRKILQKSHRYAKTNYDLEHVTSWIHRRIQFPGNKIKVYSTSAPKSYQRPEIRVTIDTPNDFRLFRNRVKHLQEVGLSFSLSNLLTLE